MLRRWSLPLSFSLLAHGLLLAWLVSADVDGKSGTASVVRLTVATATSEHDPLPAEPSSSPVQEPPRPAQQRQSGPAPVPQTAPESVSASAVAQPVADVSDASMAAVTESDAHWQEQLHHYLQAHMRYPRVARMRRQQGVAELMFELDRQGRLLALALARSSGFELLDQEALALVKRAAPLPAPPAGMAGDSRQVRVPIRFRLQ